MNGGFRYEIGEKISDSKNHLEYTIDKVLANNMYQCIKIYLNEPKITERVKISHRELKSLDTEVIPVLLYPLILIGPVV